MPIDVLHSTWPYLAILFYMMVLAMIKTLLGYFHKETSVHNLLRDSKMRRNEYLKELNARMKDE